MEPVLRFGHWLYRRGGTVWKEGEVNEPVVEHQIPFSAEWGVQKDWLYQRILEVRAQPSKFLQKQSLSALLEYLDKVRRDFVQPLSPSFPGAPLYSPYWLHAFQYYILGKCHANTDDSLEKAFQQAGFSDEEAYEKYFELWDNFFQNA